MKTKMGARRKLRAETLETRQLLHGGAFMSGDPTAMAEAAFARLNTNEDAVITADDGISERLLERLAEADTDGEEGISQAELTAQFEAKIAERAEASESRGNFRGRFRGRGGMGPARQVARQSPSDRLDSLFENDADGNGLTADEVSERIWERISAADTDSEEGGVVSVSREELETYIEAKRAERFDAAFARLDADQSGGITADEVSERRWERLSAADSEEYDGNADGIVTKDELQSYKEAKRAEREAEAEDSEGTEGGGREEVATANAQRRIASMRGSLGFRGFRGR